MVDNLDKFVTALQKATRPIVTIGFAATACVGWLRGLLTTEAFVGALMMVMTFWFRGREDEKSAAVPATTPDALLPVRPEVTS